MGMTRRELLRQVELPLALPSIIAGIRVAAVVGVGSATIAAAIGAGGLGQYIYRGLSMVDTTVILAGAIPAACLALVVDGGLLWLEGLLSPRRRAGSRRAAATAAGVLAALVLAASAVATARSSGAIVVGSKNFTEQLILGEIVAQAIERETGLPVRRQLNLGGTLICDRALRSGDIDVYVEYTGTALTTVFHRPPSNDREEVMTTVRRCTRIAGPRSYPRSASTTRSPFSCAARTRGGKACGRSRMPRESHRSGTPASDMNSWSGRTAIRGLAKTYGLAFRGPPQAMDLTLTYRALASGQIDLIAGDATAGLIKSLDLFQLEDNRHYFPPYDAVPVARACDAAAVSARAGSAGAPGASDLRGRHARDEPRRRCGCARTRTKSQGASLTGTRLRTTQADLVRS